MGGGGGDGGGGGASSKRVWGGHAAGHHLNREDMAGWGVGGGVIERWWRCFPQAGVGWRVL